MFYETGQPQAHPLDTWEEVLSWKAIDAETFRAAVPLYPNNRLPKRPRTIVCHDMEGGYLQDR